MGGGYGAIILGLQGISLEVKMTINLIAFLLGCLGTWIFADGVASLYTYTGNNSKAKDQSFWRDHSLRIVRLIVGLVVIWIGVRLL